MVYFYLFYECNRCDFGLYIYKGNNRVGYVMNKFLVFYLKL